MKYNYNDYSRLLSDIRFIYLCVYISVLSITYAIPIAQLSISFFGMIYMVIGVMGGILLLIDLFCRQVMFTPKNCGLLILFCVAMVASCISNIRYGFMDNAKTFVWQCVQMFVVASIDTHMPKETHKKQLRIIMEIFSAIWFVWVSWSLFQYVTQFNQQVFLSEFNGYKNMGFSEGRLFGVFKDPNYAALCSVAAIVCALISVVIGGKTIGNILYHGVQIIVQICYIVLSGSRSIQLGLAVAVVFLVCLLSWKYFETRIIKKRWKVFVCFLMVVLALLGSSMAFFAVKTGLSYLPSICSVPDSTSPDPTPPDSSDSQIIEVDLNRPDVVGDNVDITNNRIKIWTDYVKVFFSTPLIGASPRNALAYASERFPDMYIVQKQYSVHNSYLVLFVCTGIIGAAIMVLWLIAVVIEVFGYLIRRRNSGDENYCSILAMTFFLVVCAVAAFPLQFIFFTNSIYDVLFWMVLGYTRGFVQMEEPERYEKKPLPYRIAKKVLGIYQIEKQ